MILYIRMSTLYLPYYFSVNLCTFLLILLFRPATISYCNFKNLLFYVNMAKLFCIIMSSNKVDGRWVQTPGKQLAWKLKKTHFYFLQINVCKQALFFTSADVVSFLSGRKLAQVEITFDCMNTWSFLILPKCVFRLFVTSYIIWLYWNAISAFLEKFEQE